MKKVQLLQPRLIIEHFVQEEEARVYHVNWELSQCVSMGLEFPAPVFESDLKILKSKGDSQNFFDLIGSTAAQVLIAASKARGVEGLIISRYWLKIFKASAFEWSTVDETAIIEAIVEPVQILIARDKLDRIYKDDGNKNYKKEGDIIDSIYIERWINDNGIILPLFEDESDNNDNRE